MFITMGFGDTCLKIIAGIFQTAFVIVGLALVGYGYFTAYTILKTNSELVVSDYGTVIPSAVTIVFGIILVALIIVGCCGIFRESTCCLESYAAFLIVLAFAQLAFGGYCVIAYSTQSYTLLLHTQIKSDIENAVKHYKEVPQFTLMMDDIQEWMKCCGNVSPLKEYNFYVGDLPNNSELPLSCCDRSVISTCTKNSEMRYKDGCSEKVAQFTFITNQIMGWISIIVGTTELIAALFGICLSCCIWRMQSGSWR